MNTKVAYGVDGLDISVRPTDDDGVFRFSPLQCLRRVRCLLSRDVTANLVAALVFSRLDYGNALLAGLPD